MAGKKRSNRCTTAGQAARKITATWKDAGKSFLGETSWRGCAVRMAMRARRVQAVILLDFNPGKGRYPLDAMHLAIAAHEAVLLHGQVQKLQ